jgi:uncharacterized protein YndB with AHSA1/START domain
MTDRLSADGARSTLHMRRRLAHPPEKVWAALVEPDRIADWFPTTVRPELRVGGTVEFGFGGSGAVTELDPPRLIAYTWGTDHLRWEVVPDGDGALLLLEHSFDDRAGGASVAAGWHTCIAFLERALAGRPGEDPGIDHIALHEEYVGTLGLDTAAVEQVPDGWRVRFERQLTRPAEAAWPDLADAWPGAGSVLLSDEPKVLEREADGGRVRFELGEGTGHGARLTVTWTGADESARDAAADRAPTVAAGLAR